MNCSYGLNLGGSCHSGCGRDANLCVLCIFLNLISPFHNCSFLLNLRGMQADDQNL